LTVTEREFVDSIDCRFPYGDPGTARRLIAEGCAISANAAFAVAHELARPGRGVDAPVGARLEPLGVLQRSVAHPLSGAVLEVARRMILEQHLPVEEAVMVMEQVSAYPGEYAALSLVCMSCDDRDGAADRRYEAIVGAWQAV
jgi:hypothetical protein